MMTQQPFDPSVEKIRNLLGEAFKSLAQADSLIQELPETLQKEPLKTHCADAFHYAGEAIDATYQIRGTDDAPDVLYDVATEGHPIKGKVESPQSAFEVIDISDDPDFEF